MMSDSSFNRLTLDKVCYSIDDIELIKSVSLTLKADTLSLLIGPNGAGKTLLMKLCHQLIKPNSGLIQWKNIKDNRTPQAMVFQKPIMLRRSVAQNIDYALSLHKTIKSAGRTIRKSKIQQALEWADLTSFKNQSARTLSTGQQQRLALARAWVLEPETLFLDEPTSNLDPAATFKIESLIKSMHESGTKIIMTSHNLGQVERLADDIIFMHKGCIIEHTNAKQFFEQTQSEVAKAFCKGELIL